MRINPLGKQQYAKDLMKNGSWCGDDDEMFFFLFFYIIIISIKRGQSHCIYKERASADAVRYSLGWWEKRQDDPLIRVEIPSALDVPL